MLIIILVCSCSQPEDFFIGKWQILKVVEGNESIDLLDNWIHLKSNGSFESYDGELKKKEHGKWDYLPKEKKLLIDSEEASEWNLSMKQDTLFFHATSDDIYLISKRL